MLTNSWSVYCHCLKRASVAASLVVNTAVELSILMLTKPKEKSDFFGMTIECHMLHVLAKACSVFCGTKHQSRKI